VELAKWGRGQSSLVSTTLRSLTMSASRAEVPTWAPDIDRGPEGGPGPDAIGADAVRGDHEGIYSNEA
jgi:hypothetical protein